MDLKITEISKHLKWIITLRVKKIKEKIKY